MALSIKDSETEALARKLATHRGISLTNAIRGALTESLVNDNQLREAATKRKLVVIQEIQAQFAALPIIDPTVNADDWMYGENGLPH